MISLMKVKEIEAVPSKLEHIEEELLDFQGSLNLIGIFLAILVSFTSGITVTYIKYLIMS